MYGHSLCHTDTDTDLVAFWSAENSISASAETIFLSGADFFFRGQRFPFPLQIRHLVKRRGSKRKGKEWGILFLVTNELLNEEASHQTAVDCIGLQSTARRYPPPLLNDFF